MEKFMMMEQEKEEKGLNLVDLGGHDETKQEELKGTRDSSDLDSTKK